jgi:3-oxoacyl-[acyl-carrier protein] reductase
MDLGLNGKRALVTGASRGLGYAAARALAMEGTHVVLNSRTNEKVAKAARELAEESGVPIVPLAGDIADPLVPLNLVKDAAASLDGLDLLVTNAGGPPAGSFESFDEADWQKAIDLSFMSHVRLIRAALPFLRQSSAASVLTITSYSVKQPIPNLILSNSIRAATVNLTKSLALELGRDGIRFNSILPGWTETERVYELLSARAEANQTSVEEELDKQMEASPLGRMAQPSEFANVAAFLLSPAASYLTGVMLSVDGGMYKGVL